MVVAAAVVAVVTVVAFLCHGTHSRLRLWRYSRDWDSAVQRLGSPGSASGVRLGPVHHVRRAHAPSGVIGCVDAAFRGAAHCCDGQCRF